MTYFGKPANGNPGLCLLKWLSAPNLKGDDFVNNPLKATNYLLKAAQSFGLS